MSNPKRLKKDSSQNDQESQFTLHSLETPDNLAISKFFVRNEAEKSSLENINTDIPANYLKCIERLNLNLKSIHFSKPVDFIYNPTEYAIETFECYVKKYCNGNKTIMFFGMNPGPWGMSQTGVPFGEISSVRDWLKIEGNILKPDVEVPSRPVEGFNCHRTEVSGKRFWGLFQFLCKTPENFFKTSFVHNYCPLQLMTASGKNITPAELKITERDALFELCDVTLLETLKVFDVKMVICIGKFTETRLKKVLKDVPGAPKVFLIPHPSPRAMGNINWQEKTIQTLQSFNLLHYFTRT